MNLKELRRQKGLTQKEVAEIAGISLRSYKTYENDSSKESSFKYNYLLNILNQYNFIDEEHGLLTLTTIKEKVSQVLVKYDVNFCYLFGSYSRKSANEGSDVDLLIDTTVTGLAFYGLVEELRNTLCKKIDLLKLNQLDGNEELLRDIFKDGIRIYG